VFGGWHGLNGASMVHFNAAYEQDGEWWIEYVEELPGAIAQEGALDEVRESLEEEVELILEANRANSRRSAEGRAVIRETLISNAA
jgi:predicted RNase H-like HicB family nuclease